MSEAEHRLELKEAARVLAHVLLLQAVRQRHGWNVCPLYVGGDLPWEVYDPRRPHDPVGIGATESEALSEALSAEPRGDT